jgi:tripartite-type tricarboxylate transporter receptor subunit TctC
VTALLGNEEFVMSNSVSSVIQHVRSERLRAIGVSTLTRTSAAPDVPPIADSVPGFEALQWSGLVLPAKTPREIVMRLHKESVAVLRTAEVTNPLMNDGVIVVASTPEEFGEYIKSETVKWAQVAKAAGVEPQ